MNRILGVSVIFLLMLNAALAAETVGLYDLEEVEDVYYLKGKPYTGRVEDRETDNGPLIWQVEMKDGKLDGNVVTYHKGKIKSFAQYSNGVFNGQQINFFENGKIWRCEAYKNGKYHGFIVHFYNNGRPEYQAFYENGERNGQEIYYFPEGGISSVANYEKGIRGDTVYYNQKGEIVPERIKPDPDDDDE